MCTHQQKVPTWPSLTEERESGRRFVRLRRGRVLPGEQTTPPSRCTTSGIIFLRQIHAFTYALAHFSWIAKITFGPPGHSFVNGPLFMYSYVCLYFFSSYVPISLNLPRWASVCIYSRDTVVVMWTASLRCARFPAFLFLNATELSRL